MSKRRTLLLAALPLLVILILGVYVMALRDLRRLETDYIRSRQPSACAISAIVRFGDDLDESDLASASALAVKQAAEGVEAAKRRFEERGRMFPLPQLRLARASIASAMSAQTRLFEAMSNDPANTRDELDRFVSRTIQAERALIRARRLLLAPENEDWDKRTECL